LEYDPARRLPPMCDLYERGISLSGLSKTFALPGLRLGWLATRERALLARWLALKDYTTICNSAPGEILGIMALRAKEAIVARNLGIIRENLGIAEQFFASHQDWFTWTSHRWPIAFPRWWAALSVEQFCQGLLERQGDGRRAPLIFGNHFRLGSAQEPAGRWA
jgi:aspartate/methionine/tyrosine aminotransferase